MYDSKAEGLDAELQYSVGETLKTPEDFAGLWVVQLAEVRNELSDQPNKYTHQIDNLTDLAAQWPDKVYQMAQDRTLGNYQIATSLKFLYGDETVRRLELRDDGRLATTFRDETITGERVVASDYSSFAYTSLRQAVEKGEALASALDTDVSAVRAVHSAWLDCGRDIVTDCRREITLYFDSIIKNCGEPDTLQNLHDFILRSAVDKTAEEVGKNMELLHNSLDTDASWNFEFATRQLAHELRNVYEDHAAVDNYKENLPGYRSLDLIKQSIARILNGTGRARSVEAYHTGVAARELSLQQQGVRVRPLGQALLGY